MYQIYSTSTNIVTDTFVPPTVAGITATGATYNPGNSSFTANIYQLYDSTQAVKFQVTLQTYAQINCYSTSTTPLYTAIVMFAPTVEQIVSNKLIMQNIFTTMTANQASMLTYLLSTASTACNLVVSNSDPLLTNSSKFYNSTITTTKPTLGTALFDGTNFKITMSFLTGQVVPKCPTNAFNLIVGSNPTIIHAATMSVLPIATDVFSISNFQVYAGPTTALVAISATVKAALITSLLKDNSAQFICSDYSSTLVIPTTFTAATTSITGTDVLNQTATYDATNKAISFAPTTGMGAANCTNGAYLTFGSSTVYMYPMNITTVIPYYAKVFNVSMFYVLNTTSGFYALPTAAQITAANSIIADATVGFVCIGAQGTFTKIIESLYITVTAGTVATLDTFVN
jgi:hypothetical protein